MKLMAVDRGGQKDMLEEYAFKVTPVPAPTFRVTACTPALRTHTDDPDYTDYGTDTTVYYVGSSHKIAPLRINTSSTTFSTTGDTSVTYRLDQTDKTDFFVNGDTGVVFGKFTTAGEVKLSLVAIDAGKQEDVLETYTFAVRDKQTFSFTRLAQRLATKDAEFVDYDQQTNYYAGDSPKVAPRLITDIRVSGGTPTGIKYRLDQNKEDTDFFVNSDTGVIFGKFPEAKFKQPTTVAMNLTVIDGAGASEVLETYTFHVKPRPATFLQILSLWEYDTGYDNRDYVNTSQLRHTFAVGDQYSFPPINLTTFDASADKDDIAFTLDGAPQGFLIDPRNGFVQGSANEERPYAYNVSLVALDKSSGLQSEPLQEYTITIKKKDTDSAINGPGGKDCEHGTQVDAAPFDKKFECDCGGTIYAGANCDVPKTAGPTYPMAISSNWNENSLGPDSKYTSKYSWRDSFELAAPSLSTEELFVNYTGGDASKITYSLVVQGINTTSKNSTPGKFYTSSTGATLAKMVGLESSLGRYTGHLQATDGAGGSVRVKSWDFEVLKDDTAVPAHGPNGRACSNNSVSKDGVKLDQKFTCVCNKGYSGENCDTAPPESENAAMGSSSPSSEVYVVSAVFALLLLALAMSVIVTKARAAAERNKPFDFNEQVDKLLDAGLIVLEEDSAASLVEKSLPQEIKRKHVSLTNKLGNGAFGEVWKGVYDDPRGGAEYLVAVKMLLKETDEATKEMVQEAVVMAHIGSHKHVVNLIGTITAGTPKLLVMNFCEHGSLQDYLKKRAAATPFTEAERLKAAHDVALGMTHLEAKRVVHRDLAARNVLVDSLSRCKVADFGLSRAAGDADNKDGVEEVYYRANHGAFPVRWTAPEAMETMLFNISTDVWSYGILLLEIYLDGGKPYEGMDNQVVISRVTSGYRAFRPEGCSFAVYTEVIMPCWDKDPAARPSFVELAGNIEQLATDVADAPAPEQPRTRKANGFDSPHYNSGTSLGGGGYVEVGTGGADDDAIEAYGEQVSVAVAMERSGFNFRLQRQASAKNAKKLYGEKRKPDVVTECVHAHAA